MINSEPSTAVPSPKQNEEIDAIVSSGPIGAITVAGIATTVVLLIWVLFYLLIFLPRGGGQ